MSSVKHLEIKSKAQKVLNVRKLWEIFINNCEATEGMSDIAPPPIPGASSNKQNSLQRCI